MTKHQAFPQYRVVSQDRTLADAAALSVLAPSPANTAKLIAAIRQYADDLQAARTAQYGDLLAPADAPADSGLWTALKRRL